MVSAGLARHRSRRRKKDMEATANTPNPLRRITCPIKRYQEPVLHDQRRQARSPALRSGTHQRRSAGLSPRREGRLHRGRIATSCWATSARRRCTHDQEAEGRPSEGSVKTVKGTLPRSRYYLPTRRTADPQRRAGAAQAHRDPPRRGEKHGRRGHPQAGKGSPRRKRPSSRLRRPPVPDFTTVVYTEYGKKKS